MDKIGYKVGNIIGILLGALIATLVLGLAIKVVFFFLGVKLAAALCLAVIAFDGLKKIKAGK